MRCTLRIAQISKSDQSGGGASVVAVELTEQLRAMGHSVTHFNTGSGSENHLHGSNEKLISKLKTLAGRRGYRDHYPIELLSSTIRSIPKKYDIVHLHDMSWTMSHESIVWLSRRVPVVWTLHDCSPFTAGCLYPSGCVQFKTKCSDCPQKYDWPIASKRAKISKLHATRRELHKATIVFTGPSEWIIDQYKSVTWQRAPVEYITNGVNLDVFKPRERCELRAKYAIPDDGRPVFLFAASYLGDSRKGPTQVAAFMRQLASMNAHLLLLGRYSDDAHRIFEGLKCTHLGFVKDTTVKSELMALADGVFVFSKNENCPLVILESLACGTPVICFASGGIPSLITNGINGYIISESEFDLFVSDDLQHKVEKLIDMRMKCRKTAEERHDYKIVAKKFIDLYNKILHR